MRVPVTTESENYVTDHLWTNEKLCVLVNHTATALTVSPFNCFFVVISKHLGKLIQKLCDGVVTDRKSTRLNSSHRNTSRMPSSA